MGNEGARSVGMEKAATTIEKCRRSDCRSIFALVSFSKKPFANKSYDTDRQVNETDHVRSIP